MYYGDDKFTEAQQKRIAELHTLIHEYEVSDKIEIKNVEYFKDREFNFYCSFYQNGKLSGESFTGVIHIMIERDGKQRDLGDEYFTTPQSVKALYDKFD